MSVPGAIILGLLAWAGLSVVISPLIGARIAGRPLTPRDREHVLWAGLAIFMALFLLAVLLNGVHK